MNIGLKFSKERIRVDGANRPRESRVGAAQEPIASLRMHCPLDRCELLVQRVRSGTIGKESIKAR
ncbi:MAG: hypothetical protein RL518_542 [Pseudomonadota bacterium]